jgi:hypothetical protein
MQRKNLIDNAYVVYFDKSMLNPDAIVAKGLFVRRDYSGDYLHVETLYFDEAYYIFQIGQPVMIKKDEWWNGRIVHDLRKTVYSLFVTMNVSTYCSYESIHKAIKDTPFQYSCYENYFTGNDARDMVTFFDLFCRYPKAVEYITKAAGTGLIDGKLNGGYTYGTLNWRGKTLFKMLKMNRQQLRECKQKDIELTFEMLKMMQMAKEDCSKFSMEQMHELGDAFGSSLEGLKEILKYSGFRKAVNYIYKQEKNSEKLIKSMVLRDWLDYISECKKLNMDLTESVLFPTDLHKAHENTTRQIKILANKEFDRKIAKRAKTLKTKYSYEAQGLLIRPAVSSMELIDEGVVLKHCVGGYAKRYAEGQTNILVIRKIDDLDKPYYTMEIIDDRIIQTRGLSNRMPDEEVAAFVKAFEQAKLIKANKPKKNKITIPA